MRCACGSRPAAFFHSFAMSGWCLILPIKSRSQGTENSAIPPPGALLSLYFLLPPASRGHSLRRKMSFTGFWGACLFWSPVQVSIQHLPVKSVRLLVSCHSMLLQRINPSAEWDSVRTLRSIFPVHPSSCPGSPFPVEDSTWM